MLRAAEDDDDSDIESGPPNNVASSICSDSKNGRSIMVPFVGGVGPHRWWRQVPPVLTGMIRVFVLGSLVIANPKVLKVWHFRYLLMWAVEYSVVGFYGKAAMDDPGWLKRCASEYLREGGKGSCRRDETLKKLAKESEREQKAASWRRRPNNSSSASSSSSSETSEILSSEEEMKRIVARRRMSAAAMDLESGVAKKRIGPNLTIAMSPVDESSDWSEAAVGERGGGTSQNSGAARRPKVMVVDFGGSSSSSSEMESESEEPAMSKRDVSSSLETQASARAVGYGEEDMAIRIREECMEMKREEEDHHRRVALETGTGTERKGRSVRRLDLQAAFLLACVFRCVYVKCVRLAGVSLAWTIALMEISFVAWREAWVFPLTYFCEKREKEVEMVGDKERERIEELFEISENGFKQDGVKLRWCSKCKVWQPLRCKHCRDCRTCVRLYDHHCPWLGVCVGEDNKSYFSWYLFVETVELSWITFECFDRAVTSNPWVHQVDVPLLEVVLMICLLVGCVIMVMLLFMVISLFFYHFYLMAVNLTTWEHSSWHRIDYLGGPPAKRPESKGSPFSVSLFNNFRMSAIKIGQILETGNSNNLPWTSKPLFLVDLCLRRLRAGSLPQEIKATILRYREDAKFPVVLDRETNSYLWKMAREDGEKSAIIKEMSFFRKLGSSCYYMFCFLDI